MLDGLRSFIHDSIFSALNMVNVLKTSLQLQISPDDTFWKMFSSIYEVIVPVGIVLMLLYFCIDISESISSEQMNIEFLVKKFLRFTVAYLLVTNGLALIKGFAAFGDKLTLMVAQQWFSGDMNIFTFMEPIDAQIKNAGFGELMGMFTPIAFIKLCSLAINIAFNVIIFSRFLELGIRTMFAPIAIADVFSGGPYGIVRSSGVRYLKKILALCIQGALILAIAIGVETLVSLATAGKIAYDSVDFFGFVWLVLAIGFTGVALMLRSLSVANDIVGV